MKQKTPEIQLVFASLIQKFVVVGMALLVAGFGVYIFGLAKPEVTPQRITQLWHLEAHEVMKKTAAEDGWGWVKNITAGDSLSLATLPSFPSFSFVLAAAVPYKLLGTNFNCSLALTRAASGSSYWT